MAETTSKAVATVKVVPLEGLLVRFPGDMTPLPPEGAIVPWRGGDGTYWRRRAADGSVQVVERYDEAGTVRRDAPPPADYTEAPSARERTRGGKKEDS